MATRKIKDAKDLSTNELIYFKGHAKATYMSDGRNVEDAISQIGTGGGGGGGIAAETDPIFSASPAASITEAKKTEWDAKQEKITDLDAIRSGAEKGATALQSVPPEYVTETELNNKGYATTSALNNKVDKVSGKQLSTQDFTTELEGKLKGIEANAQKNVQSDWNESDTDSDTYVNNRTHYSYDIEQVTSFSIASKNQGDILVTGLQDGVFYRIINDAGGKNEAFHFVEGRKVVIPSNGPTIEAVCAYEDDYCLKLTTPTYGMTESFVLKEIYVEQLYDVYIPETIARKAEIATINGQSLTEGGDITIQGGGTAVDNVYITDFTVVDFYNLKNGEIEELQIDPVALSEAIIAKKTILVPYDDGYVGGYGLLLGEAADTEIYFSIYTHVGQYIYVEAYDGVVHASPTIIRDLQVEHVQQISLDTISHIAVTNALQTTGGFTYALPYEATGDEDDTLICRTSLKTINGQTIMRDGDSDNITVAYPEERATSTAMILQPNTVTVWADNVTGTIQIAFGLPLQGYVSEYIARFTVAAEGVQLEVPDRVVWADGVLPAMTPGKTYEISFLGTSGDNSITATFLEF